jgi:hypothetical protein
MASVRLWDNLRYPKPNTARGRDQKVVHVHNPGETRQFLKKHWMTLYTTEQHAREMRTNKFCRKKRRRAK